MADYFLFILQTVRESASTIASFIDDLRLFTRPGTTLFIPCFTDSLGAGHRQQNVHFNVKENRKYSSMTTCFSKKKNVNCQGISKWRIIVVEKCVQCTRLSLYVKCMFQLFIQILSLSHSKTNHMVRIFSKTFIDC